MWQKQLNASRVIAGVSLFMLAYGIRILEKKTQNITKYSQGNKMKKTFIVFISLLFISMGTATISFAKNDKQKSLPPGLQKKAAKGQSLPPGWQNKLVVGERLERDIYDSGEIVASDKKGLVTISIEGKLVKLVKDTREIVEILNGK